MAKPTSQWACIVILALMGSTLTMAHVVKPDPNPARPRKLLLDKTDEPETNHHGSDSPHKATQNLHSQPEQTDASAIGCSGGGGGEDKGIFGGGQGSGVTTIGLKPIFPFFGLPFGGLVPEITTWGGGGGYGGVGQNSGPGVSCQCSHHGFPVNYVISPVYFQPVDPATLKDTKRDGPGDMAPGPSGK